MVNILIRDDDVSAFTPVEFLERVHEPLLKQKLPLNFAVIPQIRTDIKSDSLERIYFREEGLEFEPFIPPEKRRRPESYNIKANSELSLFLNENTNIEILQHGFSHIWQEGKPEFALTDKKSLEAWLKTGKEVIKEVIGKEPTFFVPPWDSVSKEAVDLIGKFYLGLSLKEPQRRLFSLPRQLGIKAIPISNRCLWAGKFLLLGHPGYIISRFNSSQYMQKKLREVIRQEKIIVLVVHHWEFFFDWGKEDTQFLSAWHSILEELINNPEVEFINFTTLYNRLREGSHNAHLFY